MDIATYSGFGFMEDDRQLGWVQQIQRRGQGRFVHRYSIIVHHRAWQVVSLRYCVFNRRFRKMGVPILFGCTLRPLAYQQNAEHHVHFR